MQWQQLPEIKINHRYTWQSSNRSRETVHVFDEPSYHAIQAAWTSGRPLLITGDPGTGKSQLARAVAEATDWQFLSEVITSHTEIQDLWYKFDAVSRLGQAQILSAITKPGDVKKGEVPEELAPEKFLSPGVLWWAYDWSTAARCYVKSHFPHFHPDGITLHCKSSCEAIPTPGGIVLLLDEIDKADSDLPNSLLETLDAGSFRIPWIDSTVGCGVAVQSPLVIITTNEDRQLPPAFVRRCMVLNLALPEERQKLIDHLVVRGKQHFQDNEGAPLLHPDVMIQAAKDLANDRKLATSLGVMPPGQAEYLDLLRVLHRLFATTEEQMSMLEKIKDFAFRKYKGMPQGKSTNVFSEEEIQS